jgi:hypothetical protein
MKGETMAAKTKELSTTEFTNEELSALNSFDDALALLRDKVGEENVGVADRDLGDGFKLLENKDILIGVPFLLVTWSFHNGDHGEFVSAKLMTQEGQKYILNDGSTGIWDQLKQYSEKKGVPAGLFCMKGLRRSNYEYEDENGQKKPATTYYLDTSA